MNLTADENPYSVSVVIPAYNIEAYLARAIDSVLAQTQPPDEIIVVDDGSTDQTASVAQRYGSQVRYIYQENAGLSAARNTAIRNAACTWIALLDGDDEWLPDKLRLQIELLKRNPHLLWACANCYLHLMHLNQRAPMHIPKPIESLLAGREFFDDYLLAANRGTDGHPDTMIIKRQALFEVGLFREGLPFYEDHDMWWRLAYRWPQYGYLPQPLAIYYIYRPGSLTHATSRTHQLEVLGELIDRHLIMAAPYGRLPELKTRMENFITGIIKKLLGEKKYQGVLQLIQRHQSLLCSRIRVEMRLRATFPDFMMPFFNFYHRIKQKFFSWYRGAINR